MNTTMLYFRKGNSKVNCESASWVSMASKTSDNVGNYDGNLASQNHDIFIQFKFSGTIGTGQTMVGTVGVTIKNGNSITASFNKRFSN